MNFLIHDQTLFSNATAQESGGRRRSRDFESGERPRMLYPPPRSAEPRGEALLVTSDVDLVVQAREALWEHRLDLTWTRDFWMALSYVECRRFAALALDMHSEAVVEDFIPHLIDEYGRTSYGPRIVLHGEALAEAVTRQLRKEGVRLLEGSCDVRRLLEGFGYAHVRKTDSNSDARSA